MSREVRRVSLDFDWPLDIADGWAPTFVSTPETGLVSGVEFIGHHTEKG